MHEPWGGGAGDWDFAADRPAGPRGRPAEFRKMLGIDAGDDLEMRVHDGRLVLFKVTPECALCAGTEDLLEINGKFMCDSCAQTVRAQPECALCQRVDGLRQVHG